MPRLRDILTTMGKAETMEYTYKDLQRDMGSRGLVGTPITETEYNAIVKSGLGHEGAVSIALDVSVGFSMQVAWEACI